MPENDGALQTVVQADQQRNRFTVSLLTTQLRYRWEIAPLSDFFLVYTRLVDEGSGLKSFSDTFSDGYDDPMSDFLVLKVRYRFGT